MKRRDLLKTGLCALSTGAVALSGCNKKEDKVSLDNNSVIPKQTGTYEFSCPLPFDFKTIDDIVKINSKYKKSQVKSFYNNTPMPLAGKFNQWIQVNRGVNNNVKNYNDFKKYVQYAYDNGFDFTYLMNSSKVFSQKDFLSFKDEFLYLIDYLKKLGVKNVKVGNTQVCSLLQEFAPNEFNLHASTVFEYHNISQYNNLFENYKGFKLIDIAIDENTNFPYLKGLRKKYPDIKLELMVNEPCLKGCPARISHSAEYQFCVYQCKKLMQKIGSIKYFFKQVAIMPWNLEYYSAIGINNFKYLPAGEEGDRVNFSRAICLNNYFDIIENGIDNYSAEEFFSKVFPLYLNLQKNIKLSEIIDLFPDIKHFVKYGDRCISRCDVDCFYCMDCAKKIEKVLLYS